MKSKSSTLILILAVVLVVGILVYFFVIRKPSSPTADAGLVSASTGTAGAVPTASSAGSKPGDEVVSILRNLTAISLSDAVFQNPSFAMLTDLSISLPPATNPGRRNPFAPVGADAAAATPIATSTSTITPGTTSPQQPTGPNIGSGL
ncbi:MAG: hypothetical protein JWM20_787 [Patescibacteria group bacterium]|nr:hypothetical protein [Patescibacteria group bacterium]